MAHAVSPIEIYQARPRAAARRWARRHAHALVPRDVVFTVLVVARPPLLTRARHADQGVAARTRPARDGECGEAGAVSPVGRGSVWEEAVGVFPDGRPCGLDGGGAEEGRVSAVVG